MDRQVFLKVDVKGQQLVTQAVQQYASRLKLQRCLRNAPTLPAPQREALLQQIEDHWPVHADTLILNRPVREWYRERYPSTALSPAPPVVPPPVPPRTSRAASVAETALLGLGAAGLGAAGLYLGQKGLGGQTAAVVGDEEPKELNQALKEIGTALRLRSAQSTMKGIKAEIVTLQNELHYTQVITTTMEGLEAKFNAYNTNVNRDAENKTLTGTVQTLTKQKDTLTAENKQLNTKLQSLKQSAGFTETNVKMKLAECEAKLEVLQGQNDTLSEDVKAKDREIQDAKTAMEKCNDLFGEKDEKPSIDQWIAAAGMKFKKQKEDSETETRAITEAMDTCKDLFGEKGEKKPIRQRIAAAGEKYKEQKEASDKAAAEAKSKADDEIKKITRAMNEYKGLFANVDDNTPITEIIKNAGEKYEEQKEAAGAQQKAMNNYPDLFVGSMSGNSLSIVEQIQKAGDKYKEQKDASDEEKKTITDAKTAMGTYTELFGEKGDETSIKRRIMDAGVKYTEERVAITQAMTKNPGLFVGNSSITQRIEAAGTMDKNIREYISLFNDKMGMGIVTDNFALDELIRHQVTALDKESLTKSGVPIAQVQPENIKKLLKGMKPGVDRVINTRLKKLQFGSTKDLTIENIESVWSAAVENAKNDRDTATDGKTSEYKTKIAEALKKCSLFQEIEGGENLIQNIEGCCQAITDAMDQYPGLFVENSSITQRITAAGEKYKEQKEAAGAQQKAMNHYPGLFVGNSSMSGNSLSIVEQIKKAGKKYKDENDSIRNYINEFNKYDNEVNIVTLGYPVVKLVYNQMRALRPTSIPVNNEYEGSSILKNMQLNVQRLINQYIALAVKTPNITLHNVNQRVLQLQHEKEVAEKEVLQLRQVIDNGNQQLRQGSQELQKQQMDMLRTNLNSLLQNEQMNQVLAHVEQAVCQRTQELHQQMFGAQEKLDALTACSNQLVDTLKTDESMDIDIKNLCARMKVIQNEVEQERKAHDDLTTCSNQLVSTLKTDDSMDIDNKDLCARMKVIQKEVEQERKVHDDLTTCSIKLVSELTSKSVVQEKLCSSIEDITQLLKGAAHENRDKELSLIDYVISAMNRPAKRTISQCEIIFNTYRSLFPKIIDTHGTLESLFEEWTHNQVELFMTLIPNKNMRYTRPQLSPKDPPHKPMEGLRIGDREFNINNGKHGSIIDNAIQTWNEMADADVSTIIPRLIQLIQFFQPNTQLATQSKNRRTLAPKSPSAS